MQTTPPFKNTSNPLHPSVPCSLYCSSGHPCRRRARAPLLRSPLYLPWGVAFVAKRDSAASSPPLRRPTSDAPQEVVVPSSKARRCILLPSFMSRQGEILGKKLHRKREKELEINIQVKTCEDLDNTWLRVSRERTVQSGGCCVGRIPR